jgi:hypothetical protein
MNSSEISIDSHTGHPFFAMGTAVLSVIDNLLQKKILVGDNRNINQMRSHVEYVIGCILTYDAG